jgi:streptogramin lyase
VSETPLHGPRAIDFDTSGDMWIALREGNAIYRVDMKTGVIHHVAGTGERGSTTKPEVGKKATFSGPKGISAGPNGIVYLADTETHMILVIDPQRETVEPLAGLGTRGDGPDGDALKCRMARPHGVFADTDGSVYIGDSEAHRVRVLRPAR